MNSTETKTELLPDEDAKELRKWIHSFPWFAGVALRIDLRNKEMHTLRKRLEAVEKERDDFRHDVSTAATLANERGDRILELKKANGELVDALKGLIACHHEGALLCSTIENAKKVNAVETHAMKVVATAEALKGEG